MIAFLVVVAVVFVLLRRRLARRSTLAGLNGERPVFHLEPPSRRMGSRKGERL